MNRVHIKLAWFFGIALPVLETLRRRSDFSDLPAYVDDYLAGGFLLFAAWSSARGRRTGTSLLVAAWGIITGGVYYSFFGQLKAVGQTDVSGLPGTWVVVVKGIVFLTGLACLWLSIRAAALDALPKNNARSTADPAARDGRSPP